MQEITWPYNFATASEDKGTWKSGSQSLIWELAGIDGTNQGSITPHHGFREAWTFRYDQIPGASWTGGATPYSSETAPFAKIIDFWPFTCRIGSGAYTYGVVYIVQRSNSSVRDLIIEGYRTDGGGSYYQNILAQNEGLLGIGNTDYGVYVTSTPRVVYVGIRGRSGFAVTFPLNASPKIVSSGPGEKPKGTWSGSASTAFTPTTTQLPNPSSGPPGSFVVYSTLASSSAPTEWADTPTNWGTATAQKAGDYAFAVQFEDSLSGRRSQLSDSVPVTFDAVNRKFTVVGIVDSNKYDTVKIWRSVRTGNAAGIFSAGILQLEAVFLASAQPVASRTGQVSYGTAWAYTVQKDDRQLVMQDTFQDKPSFYNEVPHGGSGTSYQSQLFVSDVRGQSSDKDDQMRSVGEIRWSSASDGSYELFAPKARWNPDMYGDVPVCFHQAGQVLLGFSKNKVFFILRDGAFVRVSTAHNGYGVTSPYAAATIGPMVYYVTKQGMRAVYPDGRLDEVGALDWLISKDWYEDLDRVSMAYDPDTTCLYVMNPVKDKAVTMWFSSGIASEMHYMPFRKCARGYWPRSAGGELRDCALFLHAPELPYDQIINQSIVVKTYRPRLMMCANSPTDRVHQPPQGNVYEGVHHGMIDGPCDRHLKATSYLTIVNGNETLYQFQWAPRANSWVPDWQIIGSYVKLVGIDGEPGVSGKFTHATMQVVGFTDGVDRSLVCRFVPDAVNSFTGFDPNMLVSVNPVVVKVQTANFPGASEQSGFLLNKEVSSCGVLMSGVEVAGSINGQVDSNPVFGRWYANLYVSDNEIPTMKSVPQNPSAQVPVQSIIDGPSPIHSAFPSRVLNPHQSVEFVANAVNLTFRLLAMNVRGRILETERNRNSYV